MPKKRAKIEVDAAHYEQMVDAAIKAAAELEFEVDNDPEAGLLKAAWRGLERAIKQPDAQAALDRMLKRQMQRERA